MIRTRRELAALALGAGLATIPALAALFYYAPLVFVGAPPVALLSLPAAFVVIGSLILLWERGPSVVDIWTEQRKVMSMSGQGLPMLPALTSDVALYFALMLEELSETATTLNDTLEPSRTPQQHKAVTGLRARISDAASILKGLSLDVRYHLARVPSNLLNRDLSMCEAKALLDDATDMAVVVAGFANAAGLPGSAGYREVTRSNMSKAHPVTGVIEKTPDGKWIKGPNYTAPDFNRILNQRWVDSQRGGLLGIED